MCDNLQQMITMGPTTLPTHKDVVIGMRYDTAFLGMYDRWLDYHPGNALFQQVASQCAPFHQNHRHNNNDEDDNTMTALAQHCVQHVQHVISNTNDGRFLQQDFWMGEWRVMF